MKNRYSLYRPPSLGVAKGLRALPMGIWSLGFVSMFMDISSELIHSLLPIFMVTAFGIFNLVGGCALLLASVIAGALWSAIGA
jgi:hypothetical protein